MNIGERRSAFEGSLVGYVASVGHDSVLLRLAGTCETRSIPVRHIDPRGTAFKAPRKVSKPRNTPTPRVASVRGMRELALSDVERYRSVLPSIGKVSGGTK